MTGAVYRIGTRNAELRSAPAGDFHIDPPSCRIHPDKNRRDVCATREEDAIRGPRAVNVRYLPRIAPQEPAESITSRAHGQKNPDRGYPLEDLLVDDVHVNPLFKPGAWTIVEIVGVDKQKPFVFCKREAIGRPIVAGHPFVILEQQLPGGSVEEGEAPDLLVSWRLS